MQKLNDSVAGAAMKWLPVLEIKKLILITLVLAGIVLLQPYYLSSEVDHSIYFGLQYFVLLCFMMVGFISVARVVVHPYVFLLATLGLFIGGRFIALVTIDQPVFADANYIPIVLTVPESIDLMRKVVGGMLLMHAGFLYAYQRRSAGRLITPNDQPRNDLALASLVLLVVSALISAYAIMQHYQACSKFGYLAIYQDQHTDNLLRLASMGQYGLLLGAGLAFTTSRKWLHILAMALVAGYFISYLGVGLRSGFLSLILMGVWLVHTRLRKLNFLTLLLVPVVMIALAQLAITIGCRAQPLSAVEAAPATQIVLEAPPAISYAVDAAPESAPIAPAQVVKPDVNYLQEFRQRLRLNELGWFTYLQGSTLVYTGAAFRLEHYPVHAYLQTFIPGYSQVASRLDKQATPADFYFPHFLAKSYSQEKYNGGFGMGWSLFADFHAFSFGNILLYMMVSLLFGFTMGYFFLAAETSAIFFGSLVCVFLKITLLPRSGIYSVIPYLVVFAVLYVLGKFIYKVAPARVRRLLSIG